MQQQGTRSQVGRAAVASTIGTSIEWYDFFLYGSAAALVFPKLFFPKSDPLAGVLISFATYAVGFAARPVGAAIFGHYGDRIGRKATLIVTLLLMGLATAAVGLLPSYSSIGIWGGILLTLLRILQGIGVGGEWGGSVLLSMEWGSNKRRGLVASWPQLGVPIGLILGNGALLVVSRLTGAAFLTTGWRIPFLLSLVLVAVGLYIRLGITETPLFRRLTEAKRIERRPVAEVFRRNWREIVLSALVRVSEQAPFYIFTAFVLAYGTRQLKFNNDFMLVCVFLAAVVSLVTVPLAGHLSDRYGRRLIYTVGIVFVGLYAFPYFALLDTRVAGLVLAGVVISLIPHDLQYGPQAALIAESFTGRLRYSGASIGYQLASVIAGGPAPLIATALLAAYKSSVPIAIYIVVCALVSLVAVRLLPDRSKVDHNVEYEEQGGTAATAAPARRVESPTGG
ncbi:MAG: MHS family MFS transporter [Candidatus Dormibacteraeota bacterium]|nr:MHS family MFS transporter [Candidatus Dormibacteraeota bacterium]